MRDDVELGNAGPVPDGLRDRFTQEQWDNECCCRCYNCGEDHDHTCHYSDEERAEIAAADNEITLVGLGLSPGERAQLSDGRWLECTLTTNPAGNECRTVQFVEGDA